MFTDSHCHLNKLDLTEFSGDIRNALLAAKAANVHRMMAIMCDLAEYDEIFAIISHATTDEDLLGMRLGMSVGVHPCEDVVALQQASVDTLVAMASEPHVWAIGETGLDYYWSQENKIEQQASLTRHIQASQQLKKPLVIHTREAKHDTLDILTAEHAEHGIIHCFTEDYATAKRALDLGFYISLSGIVSFKNAKDLQAVAKQIPLDRLLIETDSPYLAPIPKRGKPNQPAYVPYVAEYLANLYSLPVETLAAITSRNFDNLLRQYQI